MIRSIALIGRRADVSRAEFRDHYEDIHAPLALPHMAGLLRYTRNHLAEPEGACEPGFDVVTSFEWSGVKALVGIQKVLAGPEGVPIRADEDSFMHRPSITFFGASDRGAWGASAPPPDATQRVVLAKAPPGAARDEFLRELAEKTLPELCASSRAPLRAIHLETQGIPGGELAFDSVTFLWVPHAAAAEPSGLASGAERVVDVRTEVCHSPIPNA